MNKLLPLLFLISLSIFSNENKEEVFQFENLRIVKNPTSILRGPISSEFLCEKAIPIQSIDLSNFTGLSPETALFLQCPQSSEDLIKFYETIFLTRDWRILQKDFRENKALLLGENQSKKVMTVLIRDEKDFRIVKIFYRRPGF